MSKSSKAKKRVVKMILAEVSILGEDNMAYDDYKKNPKQYCQDAIEYLSSYFSNREMLKYYKNVIIPQLREPFKLCDDFKMLARETNYIVQNSDKSLDDLNKIFEEGIKKYGQQYSS